MRYSCSEIESELEIYCHFKEILEIENYVKHHGDAINKIQSIGNSTGQITYVFPTTKWQD